MYVVELWKGRYFKRKSGLKRGYKSVTTIQEARKFKTIYELAQAGFAPGKTKFKIIEVENHAI